MSARSSGISHTRHGRIRALHVMLHVVAEIVHVVLLVENGCAEPLCDFSLCKFAATCSRRLRSSMLGVYCALILCMRDVLGCSKGPCR
eukprot:1696706-Pleurochrysis_carterae.AAC.1